MCVNMCVSECTHASVRACVCVQARGRTIIFYEKAQKWTEWEKEERERESERCHPSDTDRCGFERDDGGGRGKVLLIPIFLLL